MIVFLKSWILNIVTLVIFIILLEIMIPSGRVKKFINLVSGFILIIALVNPVLSVIGKGIDLKEFHIASSNFLDRKEIEKSSSILKEEQMKQTTELYRKRLIRQVEESIGSMDGVGSIEADVIINEDYNSDSFGEIKRIYLSVVKGDKNMGIKPVTGIKKVEINPDKDVRKDTIKDSGADIDNETRNVLEDKVSKLFGIDKENIVINAS